MLLLQALPVLGLCALATATATATPQPAGLLGLVPGKRKLTFDGAGNFKVVSFSDMHFGERWGVFLFSLGLRAWWMLSSTRMQETERENVFAFNATGYLDQCFAPTVARKIPFSCTHGNHDNANNINHWEEIQYEQKHYADLSYTRSDVGPKPYGPGNYWVPVYATEHDSKPALIMWFFDSRSFVSGTGDGPGPVPAAADYYWVDENTVPPYIKQQSELTKTIWGNIPPALVFVHIPVQLAQPLDAYTTEGDHDDYPGTQGFNDNNTYTGLDLPFWNALVALSHTNPTPPHVGNVLAVTSGHDHGDSWCARTANLTSGVPICFDGHSGYGGYVTPNSEVRNARVFALSLEGLRVGEGGVPVVRTWNSYENNTINDEIVLGPSYMAQYN
ncbi:Metallo-dependent phosphatase [Mycena chlorophos]|uniref:Metallo-dependent phosphatase n=1 Tax=Mycena chlorophos TaxID=658473 RepID=A0A8H6SV35_MYCCL|nr:Metallo-dependent phosphatase [Mycena chlorophos]